jgi:crotonobetainyl-CoA:carnitine CoA-transferase CaiB-like acyl-CoA transferase
MGGNFTLVSVMQGVRVIEVADYIFVPAAAGVLADWGADVIKVEHHERGDAMRGLRTYHPGAEPLGFNPVMETANRGKRSIGLNLGSEAGREVLYSLVGSADVFLTSKLAPTRRKLCFDVEHIRAVNPRIVYVRGTGHGNRGAEADSGGFDALDFWYRSGIAAAAMSAEASTPPSMPAGAFGDNTGGMYVAGGIASALFHRERTGEALTVDVSLLSSGLWTMSAGVALSGLFGTPVQQPTPGPSPRPMVYAYRTSDNRFIAICCLQGFRYFPDLCRVLGAQHVPADARFSTQQAFDQAGLELCQILSGLFAQYKYADLLSRLASFSGQWAPVQNSLEVAADRQVEANRYVGEMTTSTGTRMKAVKPPVQFNESFGEFRPSPSFNEHCEEILAEIGLDQDEIIKLKVDGAVA